MTLQEQLELALGNTHGKLFLPYTHHPHFSLSHSCVATKWCVCVCVCVSVSVSVSVSVCECECECERECECECE